MSNADMALYRAKSDGGGVHRFFEREMDRQAQKRRDMERDLRRAFAMASSNCTTSRWWISPPTGSADSNRCCAGAIPTRA
jgi:hypothetical protein